MIDFFVIYMWSSLVLVVLATIGFSISIFQKQKRSTEAPPKAAPIKIPKTAPKTAKKTKKSQ